MSKARYRVVVDVPDTPTLRAAGSPRRSAELIGSAVRHRLHGYVPIIGLSVGKAKPGTGPSSAAQVDAVTFDPERFG